MRTTDWLVILEVGDEVIVNGEIAYIEKKAKKKWYRPFSDTHWHCYDSYGEDCLVKESDIELKVTEEEH